MKEVEVINLTGGIDLEGSVVGEKNSTIKWAENLPVLEEGFYSIDLYWAKVLHGLAMMCMFTWSIQEAIALLGGYRCAMQDKQSTWTTSSCRNHEEEDESRED